MLRLTTLGALDLRDRHGHPIREVLAQPKRVAVLAFLAVEGGRGPVARDRLLAMFWPESDSAHARNALSQALHHLRQALGPRVIEGSSTHAIEIVPGALWCDAAVFVEALERGETALALDLYRGDFCPTLFVAGAPTAEEWIARQRAALRGRAQAAARTHAEELLRRGDGDAAARAARRALALQPDDEGEVRTLLGILEHSGDGAGALLAFQEYARRLASELETEPAPATKQLVEGIRRRREASGDVAAPGHVAWQPAAAEQPPSAAVRVGPVPRAAGRRRRLLLPFLGAVLVLAAIAAAVVRFRGKPPAPQETKAVAVLPFTVHGGSFAYLREGMVDLLSAKLGGTGGIRAVDPRAVIATAVAAGADSGAGAAIARRLGAQWYLTGDIVEVAGRTQLNGALYASGGSSRPLATASVTGDTSALFQLVDDLTGQLLAGLLGGRDTALTRLAAVTTSSLPALKAFLRGEQALRAGRDAQAGAAFREAALMDTAFALAQYRLSLTANWVTIPGVSPVEWARLAARHSRRLTPMVRDLLGAYQAYKEVRWADAERLYRALTAAYPDHVEAWLMLGETFFHYNWLHGAPAADAWEPLQQVRALDPGNVHALIHLARLAALEGRTRTLDSLVSEFVGRYGDAERSLELRVLRASVRGDQAERATLAREARGVDDLVAYSMLEAAFVYAQNADAALELAPRFDPSHIGSEGWPAVSAQGRRLLVSVGPATGRWDRSLVRWSALPVDAADWAFETRILMAAEPAIPLGRARVLALRDSLRSRRPYPLLKALTYSEPAEVTGALVQRYLDGLLSVRLRERQVAEQAAGELAAGGPFGALLAHALRAEIAHASGDDRRALAALDWFDLAPSRWTALPSHWGTRARFLRAEVLRALGRADEAADFYESVHSSIDAPYLALAHLRRAQLHARRGDTAQARFHYGRFRSLWQDCDPEFRPLVEQAQRELAALPAAAQ